MKSNFAHSLCASLLVTVFSAIAFAQQLELIVQAGHTGSISNIVYSPDGKLLASGSVARGSQGSPYNVKLWEIETGTELRSFEGKTFVHLSVAFSPDGKILAIGDWESIKLFDVLSGEEIKTLNSGSSWVIRKSITFSPDGKTLASEGKIGITLWDVATGKELKKLGTSDYNTVAFSPDGKFITGIANDTITLWDAASGKEVKTLSGHSGTVRSAVFSSDGKLLTSISISRDESEAKDYQVRQWDVASGKLLKAFAIPVAGTLQSGPVISSGGKTILIPAKHPDVDYYIGDIQLWDVFSAEQWRVFKQPSLVSEITLSNDGKILAIGYKDGSIKFWDALTDVETKHFSAHSSYVNSVDITRDGKLLVSGGDKIEIFNLESGERFRNINDYANSVAFSPDGKLVASIVRDNRGAIWDVSSGRKVKGFFIYTSSLKSVAFSRDGKTVLARTPEGQTHAVDVSTEGEVALEGAQEGIEFDDDSDVIKVNGRGIQAIHEGGQAKLINANTKSVLATLINIDENDWAVITPDGRFYASDGALKLMHYSYGLEVINLDQLKEMYYEPGLLQKLLGYSKEPLRPIVPLKDIKLYPEIVEQKVEPNTSRLTVKLKSRGGGIGKTEVYVNDKVAVADARDARLKANPDVPAGEVVTLMVELPASSYIKGKENQVKVVTSNYLKEIGKGNIQSRDITAEWTPPGEEEFHLPTLYAIVGGVSDYEGDQLDLRFASKDAEDFSNALRLGARRLFCPKENPNCIDKVNVTTLSTSGKEGTVQPTKENFRKAFADVAAKAKPEDILVVYMAGHGVSFGQGTDTYFYLTKEARTSSREDLAKVLSTSAISSEELTEWLTTAEWSKGQKGIRALKQVLILDTCASGTAAEKLALTAKREMTGDQIRAIEFLKDKTGTFVLMGSTADAPSYEATQYGQGLLTYSLLQAMKGAALDKGEYIDVQKLFSHAQAEVPRLAANVGGVQRPIVSAPLGKTFVIGQMTDAEKKLVDLPAPKPLLLRPLLTNPETGDDDLRLIPELRKRLDAESSYEVMKRSGKGEPSLVYIDDDSFPGGVRVTGTYTVEGDSVRVKTFLRRDGKTMVALPEVVAAREKVLDELLLSIRVELAKIH